jgi:hypothetical protein
MRTMNMANWTSADIPPRSGRLAVITGATGGPGFETALALAGAGADSCSPDATSRKRKPRSPPVCGRFPKH